MRNVIFSLLLWLPLHGFASQVTAAADVNAHTNLNSLGSLPWQFFPTLAAHVRANTKAQMHLSQGRRCALIFECLSCRVSRKHQRTT